MKRLLVIWVILFVVVAFVTYQTITAIHDAGETLKKTNQTQVDSLVKKHR